jgi:energy-coupling factor transport system permease protein
VSVFQGFRFRKVSSPIHRLDPRIKFLYVSVIFLVAIIFNELLPLIILFFAQIPFIYLAGVQRDWLRSMKGAIPLAFLIFVTNLISTYLYAGSIWSLPLLENTFAMTLRFIVLIESFSLFFLTTSPDYLSLALEQSHIPYEFCFAFTTAIRFIPVLAEEAQTIMDAQKARGLELEGGKFLKRIRNYIPVLIPLIVSSIRRSLELAEAMESRAWGSSNKRTSLYVLKMKGEDYLLASVSIIVLILALYARFSLSVPSITSILS